MVLILILGLLGNVFSNNLSFADEKATQVTLHGVIAKQPRNGTEIIVVCYYYEGKLYFELGEQVQNISISLTQISTGEQLFYDYEFSHSISVDVPTDSGYYYVEINFNSSILYGYYQL